MLYVRESNPLQSLISIAEKIRFLSFFMFTGVHQVITLRFIVNNNLSKEMKNCIKKEHVV